MSAYVDYGFYKENWKGSLVDETAFSRDVIRASAEIDRMTFGRLVDTESVPEEVKFATCAVLDEQAKLQSGAATHAGKKSETVGNYSVTYDEELTAGSVKYHKLMKDAAEPYLVRTGLTSRGVVPIGY